MVYKIGYSSILNEYKKIVNPRNHLIFLTQFLPDCHFVLLFSINTQHNKHRKECVRENNDHSNQILPLIAGIGIGVGLVAWMQGRDGKNGQMLKDTVTKAGKTLRASLSDTWDNSQETMKELFGETNAQTQLAFMRTRQQLNERVNDLVEEFGKLSKDKYVELVSEIVEDLQENKSMSNEQIKTLKKYLNSDYTRLQKKLSE
jgi:polyhydroxyalkanoate synthesis regulator phasin